MIKAFGSDISGIKAYGSDVTKVMAYGEEVWSKQTSIPDYLCFTALEAGTFTLTVPAAVTSTNLSYVEYSLDGRNWTRLIMPVLAQRIGASMPPFQGWPFLLKLKRALNMYGCGRTPPEAV